MKRVTVHWLDRRGAASQQVFKCESSSLDGACRNFLLYNVHSMEVIPSRVTADRIIITLGPMMSIEEREW